MSSQGDVATLATMGSTTNFVSETGNCTTIKLVLDCHCGCQLESDARNELHWHGRFATLGYVRHRRQPLCFSDSASLLSGVDRQLRGLSRPVPARLQLALFDAVRRRGLRYCAD